MKSLKFKRLVLVSDTTKSANQFKFKKRFNLITGRNNSIGKSSLIKNLFWSIGCEPDFDETWKSLDCKVLVEFTVDGHDISILRVKDTVCISKNGNAFERYFKITGSYSKYFAELVNFKAKLPNRSDNPKLETPPPAFYFLPFYIDQIKSWSNPWDSFDKLSQYARWKQPIVKYHTGYLIPDHFEIEEKIFEFESEKRIANEEIKKINTTLAIVEKYIPKTNLGISVDEFDEITKEAKEELGALSLEQEKLLSDLSETQSSRYHLESQLSIAKRAVLEIEKDYQFTVENIEGDDVECPLCGTVHDNSLVSRASILSDKQQAEDQVIIIKKEIGILSQVIGKLEPRSQIIRQRIREINQKYNIKSKDSSSFNLNDLIDGFASKSVQRNVEESKNEKEAFFKRTGDSQKELKKKQRKLTSNKTKSDLSNQFTGQLSVFLEKLNAKGVNLNKVKHPTDYNKLFGSGGAAEGTRAVLAYQMSIFRLIYYSENEIPAPFVIDTPNQQEQANKNYSQIIKLIMEDTPTESQIILCGMDNNHLKPYKKNAHIIQLDDSKLLHKKNYKELNQEISKILETAIKKL